jgi:hypothetical protein
MKKIMTNSDKTIYNILATQKKTVSQIKKMHYSLFAPTRKVINRPKKVLVSLSEEDNLHATNLMKDNETLASHVYKYYKKGISS